MKFELLRLTRGSRCHLSIIRQPLHRQSDGAFSRVLFDGHPVLTELVVGQWVMCANDRRARTVFQVF